jgi:UDP-glucose 4-epimerase
VLQSSMSHRRVLVTGGAGFIGSHIVDEALAAGHEVAVIDNLSTGNKRNLNPAARFFAVDITDACGLDEAFASFSPDFVIHHAAQIDVRRSVSDPAHDAAVNIGGSLNVLEACRRHGVRKVVYASSAALYGDPRYLPVDEEHPVLPMAPYGASKHTVEHYLEIYRELHGLPYMALRYSNVYGPRQDPKGEGGVVAIFTGRLLAGEEVVIYGAGEQTRDFIYVGDVARANLLALASSHCGIVNISGGGEISINDLFQRMVEACGRAVSCVHAPERSGEIRRSVLANDRARALLGWSPNVPLVEGLRQTFASQSDGRVS